MVNCHWNLEDGDELEEMADRDDVLIPGRDVVAQPVAYIGASPWVRGARDYHRSEARSSREHGLLAGLAHHRTVEVMCV